MYHTSLDSLVEALLTDLLSPEVNIEQIVAEMNRAIKAIYEVLGLQVPRQKDGGGDEPQIALLFNQTQAAIETALLTISSLSQVCIT